MICFNCEVERAYISCFDLLSHKKTYSTDINIMKMKPANQDHQLLPYFDGKYETKQNKSAFESVRKDLMKEDGKMVLTRRFERIYKMMDCKSYTKIEDNPENKEIFIYGFKNIKTDKFDTYILIGCESHELYKNDKLFLFWSNKFIKKE